MENKFLADSNDTNSSGKIGSAGRGNEDVTNTTKNDSKRKMNGTSNNSQSDDDNSRLPAQETWVFHGCLVHSTVDQPMSVMKDMVIGVTHGKILFVEPSAKLIQLLTKFNIPKERVVHMTDSQFLMPGLVDCHAHASQYSYLGTGTDLDLLAWLQEYTFPAETRLTTQSDHGFELYKKCVDRTLKCGTTTISYYATVDRKSTMALVKALECKGQRALVGKVNMDRNGPTNYIESTDDSVKDTNRFLDEMLKRKGSLVEPCITPRFALSCTMELMKDLSEIAKRNNLPIQTHLSENLEEVRTVCEVFPQCTNYCDVYDKAGLLGQRTLLAHVIHLSHQELTLIRKRGCGVCHCPNSNFSLSSGVMNLRLMLDMGIKVGLGTDFAGGPSPSMLDAIRRALDAVKLHNIAGQNNNNETNCCIRSPDDDKHLTRGDVSPITFKHLFRLATLGSCQVMGLDDVIGNFQVGKEFDALLVDVSSPGSPIDIFETDSKEDVIQKFIFLGDDRNITRVFVQGRQLIDSTASCTK